MVTYRYPSNVISDELLIFIGTNSDGFKRSEFGDYIDITNPSDFLITELNRVYDYPEILEE